MIIQNDNGHISLISVIILHQRHHPDKARGGESALL